VNDRRKWRRGDEKGRRKRRGRVEVARRGGAERWGERYERKEEKTDEINSNEED
jgi:hypothetical protein